MGSSDRTRNRADPRDARKPADRRDRSTLCGKTIRIDDLTHHCGQRIRYHIHQHRCCGSNIVVGIHGSCTEAEGRHTHRNLKRERQRIRRIARNDISIDKKIYADNSTIVARLGHYRDNVALDERVPIDRTRNVHDRG